MTSLRRGADGDLTAVAAVWAAATAARDGAPEPPPVGLAADVLRPVLERPDSVLVVVEQDGQVVAFALAAPSEPAVAELHYLGVAPDRWGSGTGRMLVDGAADELAAAGFDEAVLWVYADNGRALALYERTGWRRDGAERQHARSGRLEVRYRKRLRGPLMSPERLRRVLGDVTVLDVRYRMGGGDGRQEFLAGHVPGAAFVDLDADLAAPPGAGGRHPLPEAAAFETAMRRVGVRDDRPVVVYDDWAGRAAARAWWLLRFHGHRDVRVLDGGWPAWQASGGPVETGDSEPVGGDFTSRPGGMPVVEAADVPRVGVLIDARAPERYRGDVEPIDPVAGHIPGAVNVPTERNLQHDGRFRSPDQLRETYAAAGAVAGADVGAYCGSGVTAAHDVLALEVAGVAAALYPGSWSGWITDPERPVERG